MPIYFIQAVDGGPVKIGFAADPVRRLHDLQVSHHKRLQILRVEDGQAADERRLHQTLSSYRIQGEWFEPTDAVLSAQVSCAPGTQSGCGGTFQGQLREILQRQDGTRRNGSVLLARDAGGTTRSAENWLSGACLPNAAALVRIMSACQPVRDFIIEITACGRQATCETGSRM